MIDPLRIGIVGCGSISGIYFENCAKFDGVRIVACSDLDFDRAQSAASKHEIERALTPADLLADPQVELVLNLTVPKAHGDVALAALKAGKHVYNEKPLAVTREQAAEMLRIASENRLRVGGAPDTFLGGAHQTCRKLIDDGAIGEPVAAQAFMLCHGHESWHPSPEFYYEVGGGPMFDMGPYYLTDLINMLGPIRRVTGSARASFQTRTITSQPKAGKIVPVETPTHLVGILDFAQGAIGEIATSFDVWHASVPPITIFGSEGTLSVPDPNGFGGEVRVRRHDEADWRVVPTTHGFNGNDRGVGLMDMAYAIRTGRAHRASGALAAHVLDTMQSVIDSSERGRHIELSSGVDRPEAMPAGNPSSASLSD